MGAVRMRVQTADKNNTIIHTTPVHQLTSCEAKSGFDSFCCERAAEVGLFSGSVIMDLEFVF